ncbi:Protein of unknown function [Gryllus bimaculatus]|nr:Protein of unknown function [Gryllus bimaculatus]
MEAEGGTGGGGVGVGRRRRRPRGAWARGVVRAPPPPADAAWHALAALLVPAMATLRPWPKGGGDDDSSSPSREGVGRYASDAVRSLGNGEVASPPLHVPSPSPSPASVPDQPLLALLVPRLDDEVGERQVDDGHDEGRMGMPWRTPGFMYTWCMSSSEMTSPGPLAVVAREVGATEPYRSKKTR